MPFRKLICLLTICIPLLAADSRAAQWFKGNLHTHSFWSDGDDFPEMIAAWYKTNGYQFLALSDHNILLEGEKWITIGINKTRLLALDTALGANVLGVRSISVREQISRLFEIEAELSSEDAGIDFNQIVGHNATVRLEANDKTTRYFNGFVSRFVQVANQGGYAHYRATLVPWLWFLTRTADCRIFQEKTVPEIIESPRSPCPMLRL